MLGVNVFLPYMDPQNMAPFFDGQIMFRDISMDNIKKDDIFVIQLPDILDSDPSAKFKVKLVPKKHYIDYNSQLNQVTIYVGMVPDRDMSFKLFQI